jgi:hypothetical protein
MLASLYAVRGPAFEKQRPILDRQTLTPSLKPRDREEAVMQEQHRGFTITWKEPRRTSGKWTVNVHSDDSQLAGLLPGGAAVPIDGATLNDANANARKYIDELVGIIASGA